MDTYVGHQKVSQATKVIVGVLTAIGLLFSGSIAVIKFAYSKADQDELTDVSRRVRKLEDNEIRQTAILDQISKNLDHVSTKLDQQGPRL